MARKFSTILQMTAIIAGFGLIATAVQAGPNTPKISPPNISPMRPDFSMRARDMWQVIDQVSVKYLGGAPNTQRYRTQSHTGAVTIGWKSKKAKRQANVGGCRC